MSTGKYLSLEEARKDKKLLERFIKEHPSEGDEKALKALAERMSSGPLKSPSKAKK